VLLHYDLSKIIHICLLKKVKNSFIFLVETMIHCFRILFIQSLLLKYFILHTLIK